MAISDRQNAQGLCVVSCGDCETSGMCAAKRTKHGFSILPTKGYLVARISQIKFNLATVNETIERLTSEITRLEIQLEDGQFR